MVSPLLKTKNHIDSISYIDTSASAKSSSCTNSALNPNDEILENAVGDKLNITTGDKNQTTGDKKKLSQMIDLESDASVIGPRIKKLCEENGLDLKQLINGIDIITGLDNPDKKRQLSDKQRAVILAFVECILKGVIYQNKHKNKDISIIDGVLYQAARLTEYIVKGNSIENLQEINSNAENFANNFLSAINNIKNKEDIVALIDALEAEMKKERDAFEKSIENLPEDERKQAKRAKFDSESSLFRNFLFAKIAIGSSNEVAVNTISIVSSEDIGQTTKDFYKMQKSDAAREKLANEFHSFGLDQRILMAYQARGEAFNKEAWEEYVQVNASWKTEDNLTQYHNEVIAAAKEGKLTSEAVKATAKGIGVGAQINHVMTKDEINRFVEKWSKDVEKYYKNNPEALKELKTYVKQQVEEYNKKLQTKLNEANSYQTAVLKQTNVSVNRVTNPIAANRSSAIDNALLQSAAPSDESKKAESGKVVLTSTSTVNDIAKAITTGDLTVVEAISNYRESGYEALFESRELFLQNRPIAELYINYNNKNLKKLLSLSKFSSSVELISKKISPTIKDEYIKKVKLSLTMKEAVFGKDEKYARS